MRVAYLVLAAELDPEVSQVWMAKLARQVLLGQWDPEAPRGRLDLQERKVSLVPWA